MKSLLLFCALATLATSCTTLSNRRDLYRPSEDAGPYHSLKPAQPTASTGGTAAGHEEPLPPAQ